MYFAVSMHFISCGRTSFPEKEMVVLFCSSHLHRQHPYGRIAIKKICPAYSKTAFSRPASRYSEVSQCLTLPRQRMKWSCHFMNDFSHPFCNSSLSHYTNQSSSLSRLHPRTHASVTSIYFTHRRSPKLYAQAMIPSAFCIITGYSYLRLLFLLDIPRQPSPCSTRRIYGQVLPLSSEIAIATGHLSLGHTVVFTSSFIFTGL